MAYEPNTGVNPPQKKPSFFSKRNILVISLLASIVTASVVVITLAVTGNLTSSSNYAGNNSPGVALTKGAQLVSYDNKTSRLNGGVVCEDFAADAQKTTDQRNFSVVLGEYADAKGTVYPIANDIQYDDALKDSTVTSIDLSYVRYYGRLNAWTTVKDSYTCSLLAQKYDDQTGAFFPAPANTNQALESDPVVFPISNAQVVQPSALASRLFKTPTDVLAFYDFFFNYFNHGPEIMDLTTISFKPTNASPNGTVLLGDYVAPGRELEINIPFPQFRSLNDTPFPTQTDPDFDLDRRISIIWPVLAHEYGHHMVETYAKRLAVDSNLAVIPSNLSLVDPSENNCSSVASAIRLPTFNSSYYNCDSGLFNYGLMNGILEKSGYDKLLIVKDVNYGTKVAPTDTFSGALAFPHPEWEQNTYYKYIISNEVVSNPSNGIGNDYRFSYDEIMARLYNLASAPNMNEEKTYTTWSGGTINNTADNFQEEYNVHERIAEQFPATKPMIDQSQTSEQELLRQIGSTFEDMRASGAPLSYIYAGAADADGTSKRILYGTSPNKEKYMLLKDDKGAYSTLPLDYGKSDNGAPGAYVLDKISIDNSSFLIGDNNFSRHGNEIYEWYGRPLNYKTAVPFQNLFQEEANNVNTFMAVSGVDSADLLSGRTIVGFTDTRLDTASSMPPTVFTKLTINAADYQKAYFQDGQTRYFKMLSNSTSIIKTLKSVSDAGLIHYTTFSDSFSALIDTQAGTIRFSPSL